MDKDTNKTLKLIPFEQYEGVKRSPSCVQKEVTFFHCQDNVLKTCDQEESWKIKLMKVDASMIWNR